MSANPERLFQDVKFLTSIFPFRNYKNEKSLNAAADYIAQTFTDLGLSFERQQWEVNQITYENVIASYQPQHQRRLIIGAHYDVYKDTYGADDNASGVATVLELARLFKQSTPSMDYGIDFAAYSLEEPPFFRSNNMGSYQHARSVFESGREIIGMVALEMLGYYGEKKANNFQKGPYRIHPKNFLIVAGIDKYAPFNQKIQQALSGDRWLIPMTKTFSALDKNAGPSDHRNFWKFDYPAVMLIGSSGEKNPHYHKITDTIDTLDFSIMARAVDACFRMLKGMDH